jgi:uncharacterized protein YxjI
MVMRGRREERQAERETFGRGGTAVRYQMREKLVSIGDDYWIENDHGQRAYKVDGKALRVRKTLIFEDAHGQELCQIQEQMLRIKDTMSIDSPNGQRMALVKKALITPLRERFDVQIENGPDLEVQGNLVDHEYTISDGGHKVAEVSRRWFRVRETYGVEIEPGQNEVLMLAVSAALDMMG